MMNMVRGLLENGGHLGGGEVYAFACVCASAVFTGAQTQQSGLLLDLL